MALTPYGYQYTGDTSVFIPSYDGIGSGKLVVAFSRNEKDYLVNQMVTITPVNQIAGYWPRYDPAEIVRWAENINEYAWKDGQEFPAGAQDKVRKYNLPFTCTRSAFPYPIGYIERDQSPDDLSAMATNRIGNEIMLLRSRKFYTLAQDPNNYYAENTFSVAAQVGTVGATWANATSANPYIRKTFNALSRLVALKSNGIVGGSDLICIISPQVAEAISSSGEIIDYIKPTPQSWNEIRGDAPNQNKNYSIPDMLYGIKVIVDNDVWNPGPRGQDNRRFFTGANEALFLCKPGAIKAQGPATSFSSIHMFAYAPQEAVLQSRDEPWNQRILYQGWDMTDFKFVSPETSFRVTNVATAA